MIGSSRISRAHDILFEQHKVPYERRSEAGDEVGRHAKPKLGTLPGEPCRMRLSSTTPCITFLIVLAFKKWSHGFRFGKRRGDEPQCRPAVITQPLRNPDGRWRRKCGEAGRSPGNRAARSRVEKAAAGLGGDGTWSPRATLVSAGTRATVMLVVPTAVLEQDFGRAFDDLTRHRSRGPARLRRARDAPAASP